MSVRLGLLAILDQAPCHGYLLRAEFESRTGGTWPVNVGQVYTTLDRLERDGLVSREGDGEAGRALYAITAAGRAEVAAWLASPVERGTSTRDELAIKLALAVTLPGVDIARVIQVQRVATLRTLQELTRTKSATSDPESADDLAWLLLVDALIFQAEAEARWLDHTEARLARLGDRVEPRGLTGVAPRARRTATASVSGTDGTSR
ncbi:PadR family transcriptional regulator [Galbitalea sp. SE-J8]|uniref:PadR family transcriptional regulator n=1 Tax=Galbitalea sp. SE-J8 TaxID=3054952 RepID=UPI00259CD7AD|nr:PadR family transcriptional regulator [Galbitalea sp. SE-J8]MDM4761942.1 PadR family transcriptional regulator [Galbitalea sp. SE-J8]